MESGKNKFFKAIKLEEFDRSIEWRKKIASKQKAIASSMLKDTDNLKCCPICELKNSKLFVVIYDHPYYECNNCGHLYLKNQPSEKSISKLYKSDDNETVKSVQEEIYIDKLLYKKRVKEISTPKAEFASKLIKGKGKWIDIGAGVGDLIFALKKMGWDSTGYESDKNEVTFAKSMGVDLINKFLTPSDLSLIKKVKVVSALNFLEHLKNPQNFVLNISNNIEVGSYFLFEVPRWPSISAVANKCFPELSSRNIYSPDHLHIFSDKSIKMMLDNSKLEIVSSWYYGQDIYELFGNVFANSNFQNHHLVDKSISIVNKLQKVVDENGLSDTALILAKKY